MELNMLEDALIGLCAYDEGAVDSGIHDEILRQKCVDCLNAMDGPTFSQVISRLVRESFLSEKALELRYGIADALGFTSWLNERMGQDVEGTF